MRVLGARLPVFCCGIWLGMGAAMRECSDEVRLGTSRLPSSRVGGRADSPERERGKAFVVKEGAMIVD